MAKIKVKDQTVDGLQKEVDGLKNDLERLSLIKEVLGSSEAL